MKVILNIEKRYAYFIIGLLIILVGVVAVNAEYFNPTTKVGHDASSVGPGTFGGGASDDYYFSGPLTLGSYGSTNVEGAKLILVPKYNSPKYARALIKNPDGNLKFVVGATEKEVLTVNTAGIDVLGNLNVNSGDLKISSGKNICLGTSCITTWPTASAAEYLPGMHCGIYVAGTTDDQGKIASNKMVPCSGKDPSIECPSGFQRVGGDFENSGYRHFFTCVKCANAGCTDATNA